MTAITRLSVIKKLATYYVNALEEKRMASLIGHAQTMIEADARMALVRQMSDEFGVGQEVRNQIRIMHANTIHQAQC